MLVRDVLVSVIGPPFDRSGNLVLAAAVAVSGALRDSSSIQSDNRQHHVWQYILLPF